MKSNRGVTVASLLMYIAALTIIIGTLAAVASNFYKNVDNTQSSTSSAYTYTKFIKYIVKEINTEGNEIVVPAEENIASNYVIFSASNNQYEFVQNEKSLYMNSVKICSGITDCKFTKVDEGMLKVEIETKDGEKYTTIYHLVEK